MKKQKGSILVQVILGIVIVATGAMLVIMLRNNNSSLPQTLKPFSQPTKTPQAISQNPNSFSSVSAQPKETSSVKKLDFAKILNEQYSIFKTNVYGFSLQYPSEATVYDYTSEEIKEKGFPEFFSNAALEKATNINLTPIISKTATEFYEGFYINIFFLKNNNKLTLEQFVIDNFHQKEEITINGQQAFKAINKDPRANIYNYFLIDKSHEYFIVLEVFSIGNDLIQYQKIVDKIISSIVLF